MMRTMFVEDSEASMVFFFAATVVMLLGAFLAKGERRAALIAVPIGIIAGFALLFSGAYGGLFHESFWQRPQDFILCLGGLVFLLFAVISSMAVYGLSMLLSYREVRRSLRDGVRT